MHACNPAACLCFRTRLSECKIKLDISKLSASSRDRLRQRLSRLPSPSEIVSSLPRLEGLPKITFPKRKQFKIPAKLKMGVNKGKKVDLPDVEVLGAPKTRFSWVKGEDDEKSWCGFACGHAWNEKNETFLKHECYQNKIPDIFQTHYDFEIRLFELSRFLFSLEKKLTTWIKSNVLGWDSSAVEK